MEYRVVGKHTWQRPAQRPVVTVGPSITVDPPGNVMARHAVADFEARRTRPDANDFAACVGGRGERQRKLRNSGAGDDKTVTVIQRNCADPNQQLTRAGNRHRAFDERQVLDPKSIDLPCLHAYLRGPSSA
jgi:hypothetical protein